MNRPPCCWIIGWYAERPCRSWEPLSTISLASGALPGPVCAELCPALHSSSKTAKAQYGMTLLIQCVIVQTPFAAMLYTAGPTTLYPRQDNLWTINIQSRGTPLAKYVCNSYSCRCPANC